MPWTRKHPIEYLLAITNVDDVQRRLADHEKILIIIAEKQPLSHKARVQFHSLIHADTVVSELAAHEDLPIALKLPICSSFLVLKKVRVIKDDFGDIGDQMVRLLKHLDDILHLLVKYHLALNVLFEEDGDQLRQFLVKVVQVLPDAILKLVVPYPSLEPLKYIPVELGDLVRGAQLCCFLQELEDLLF